MVRKGVCCIVAFLLLALAVAEGAVVLNEDNFELNTYKSAWLILFYHPGECNIDGERVKSVERCKVVNELVMEVLQEVSDIPSAAERPPDPFQVGKVNCKTDGDPCLDFGVKKNYPLVGLFYHGMFRRALRLPSKEEGGLYHLRIALVDFLEEHIEGGIVRLTDANMEGELTKGEWMVMFTQPFDDCQRCMHSFNLWWRLSERAVVNDLHVGRVMCGGPTAADTAKICEKYVPEGSLIPSLKYFKGVGTHEDYVELWHVDNILKWLKDKRKGPELQTEESSTLKTEL